MDIRKEEMERGINRSGDGRLWKGAHGISDAKPER